MAMHSSQWEPFLLLPLGVEVSLSESSNGCIMRGYVPRCPQEKVSRKTIYITQVGNESFTKCATSESHHLAT
jgi:hypothetical protein